MRWKIKSGKIAVSKGLFHTTPCAADLLRKLKAWERLKTKDSRSYAKQAKILRRFFATYPRHGGLEEETAKVTLLNVFYSTRLQAPAAMAKHIIGIRPTAWGAAGKDEKGRIGLVNEIAKWRINGREFCML